LLHLIESQSLEQKIRAIYRNGASIEKTKYYFANYKEKLLFEQIEWVQADITDVHLRNCFLKYIRLPLRSDLLIKGRKINLINIEGTANVVNFALYGIENCAL
jgi:hypothetical protein